MTAQDIKNQLSDEVKNFYSESLYLYIAGLCNSDFPTVKKEYFNDSSIRLFTPNLLPDIYPINKIKLGDVVNFTECDSVGKLINIKDGVYEIDHGFCSETCLDSTKIDFVLSKEEDEKLRNLLSDMSEVASIEKIGHYKMLN